MLKRTKGTLFLNLLTIFVLILMPIYFLGFGIYQWGRQITTDEIFQSLHSRSSFFMTKLEDEVKRIKALQVECLTDDLLYYYVNAQPILSKFQTVNQLLSIQKRLSTLQYSSTFIESASLWLPRTEKEITAKSNIGPEPAFLRDLRQIPRDGSESDIQYMDGKMFLTASYPLVTATPQADPQYVLVIELSQAAIRKELLSFNTHATGGVQLSSTSRTLELTEGQKLSMDANTDTEKGGRPFHINGNDGTYTAVETSSAYLGMRLISYMSDSVIYGTLNQYRNLFLIFTVVALILAAVYLWMVNRFVNKPMKLLVGSLQKVERGELWTRIQHESNDEFNYLYTAFNQMVASLENMFDITYKQRLLAQQAELKQLQAQINPHFLYNSFFILYRMAKDEDYENITELLIHLSEYYRYITRNAREEVALQDEVNHALGYAKIQLVRFKRRLSIDFDPLPQAYASLPVPRLFLQPLLENAFDHGLKDKISGGYLHLWFEDREECLCIHLTDNGQGLSSEGLRSLQERLETLAEGEEVTGIVNIQRRLRIKFGKEYGMTVQGEEGGGLHFTVMLPKSEKGGEANVPGIGG